MRMGDDILEERTLEVLNIPTSIDDDLLSLYFENKRSGGGPLTSVDRQGGKATIVFEDANDAARVFSKSSHILSGATLKVQRKAPSDPQRFLLRGLDPHTSTELVELYVENVIGLETDEYKLFPSPGKNLVVIQFLQPISEDFQSVCAKVSKRPLDGAKLCLERLERTDSILVENLHPSTSEEMLSLYFESNRGGGEEVTNVEMVAEGIARVSFKDFESVDKVVTKTHIVDNTTLNVKPYFTALLPENIPLSGPCVNGTSNSVPMEIDPTPVTIEPPRHPVSPGAQATPLVVAHAQFTQQTIPASLARRSTTSEPPSPSQAQGVGPGSKAAAPIAATSPAAAAGTKPKQAPSVSAGLVSSSIAVSDPVKLSLLEKSCRLQELQTAHFSSKLSITKDGVSISAPDQLGVDKLKSSVLEFLGGIAQSPLPLEPHKAEFLAREDVKARLLQTLKDQGLLSTYTVTDGAVSVTSLSLSMANGSCQLIKSQISEFSIPVQRDYECNLYCQEWSTFLQALSFCSARVTDGGAKITVINLTGMEDETQTKIIQFLSTPIQRETVISMEPGRLKYLQIHCEQLLADMDQVTLFPLETGDGLTISGNAGECQMAEEVLRAVVESICTKTITVRQPGVARFLVEQEGSSILAELQAKFQVYVSMDKVHWEPLEEEDIFESGWKIMAQENFLRIGDALASSFTPTALVADRGMERSRIEEAKQLLSVIDVNSSDKRTSLTSQHMTSEEDIYTASGGAALDGTDASAMQTEASPQASPLTGSEPSPLVPEDAGLGLATQQSLEAMDASSLDEDARMSLAIQYSMESSAKRSAPEEDEEDELQKVLELSLRDFSAAAAFSPASEQSQLKQAMELSLQDAIRAANVAEIFVFATYTHDLIRTDIALGKKVGLRQCEEKVESRNLKNLTAHHQRCLDLIRRKHAVDIRVEGTTAIISGFKDFVAEAVPTVRDLAKRMCNVTSDAEILKTVQWVWHEQGAVAAATPYPPEATVYLENAWKMRQRKIDILLDHQPHVIDLEKMQEINVASGKSMAIARQLLNSADLTVVVPEEEFSLLSSLPDVAQVDESSDEFQDVVKEFYESIQEFHNKIKIIKVEKLMNALLYNQYKLKKASMQQTSTDPQVERTLFHGTSETSVKEICIHGFNRSFCGKNATVYGQGVYFAVNSALSVSDTYSPPNADGHKFIFMAKVLTGDYTVGKHEMKTAPLKESSAIPLRYDSVADKVTSPTLFVIFNDTQAYPEYLVTCQKIYR
ncbi:protein mono-ADP-ribosyltransferase PARP10 isoform X1 [Alosa sapidissima]|uniref:protein mono-ADP-ribosyltransferase PARP10 isoform X1 n=2 Tax=Alosa sapidissima TaxID=34773 RepID=UPI001C0A3369|nr:protein mono-ADP-ribosyltransferase PARP10 isoform X1 [Alosa sapidissima]